jgi:hypothetical protein
MLTDLSKTLQTAVRQLEVEKQHIEQQIAAVRRALDGAGRTVLSALPRRRRMSATERRAVSLRMKAYWARKRVTAGANSHARRAKGAKALARYAAARPRLAKRPRRMSAAARRAIGRRMKAYWAKRRAATKKGAASTRRGGKR